MNELWKRLLTGLGQIGSVLPAFLAAGLILVTGYVLARQV